MKITPNFDSVVIYCQKPNCSGTYLNRHHIEHPAMWFWLPVLWIKELEELKKKYKLFEPYDIVHICTDHHAEIHLLYDAEIEKYKRKLGNKQLKHFTYKQAKKLMQKLRRVCEIWMTKQTTGMDTKLLPIFRGRKGLPKYLEES